MPLLRVYTELFIQYHGKPTSSNQSDIYFAINSIELIKLFLLWGCQSVLPRIKNFGQIRIPNNIHIFKNDEYEYYSEFEKLFEYYSWKIFE